MALLDEHALWQNDTNTLVARIKHAMTEYGNGPLSL